MIICLCRECEKDEMNISVCIECGVHQNSPWYIFRLCSHAICQICYDRLSEANENSDIFHEQIWKGVRFAWMM